MNRLDSVILDGSPATAGNHSDEEQHQQQQQPHEDQPMQVSEADEEVPQKGKTSLLSYLFQRQILTFQLVSF